MIRALQARILDAGLPPRPWRQSLSRAAPGMIIAAILGLAAAVIVGEWRDGTLGPRRIADARAVVFEPRPDGTLAVHLTRPDGAVSRIDLPSSREGFVPMMAISLGRDRKRFDVAENLPFQLLRYENGTMMLRDPVIGTEIRLEAFGPTNVAAFATLMTVGSSTP